MSTHTASWPWLFHDPHQVHVLVYLGRFTVPTFSQSQPCAIGLDTPPGYVIVQTHRSSRGGGVGVIYRDSLRTRLEKCEKYSSFEHQTVNLFSDSDVLRIITVYNPSWNFITIFHTECNDLLCHLQTTTGKHLIVGDFNFNVNNQSDSGTNKFKALLNQYTLL